MRDPASPESSTRGKRRHPWRENLECLAVAIVLALTLKVFALEAYKIPTGSMQPTLMGSDEAGIYDRILVDKLAYFFRDPERWEIVVFRFPLDLSKNYIKRIGGVGPEWFRIEHGDLFRRATERDEWEIARKPRAVQESIWKTVYRGPSRGEDPFRSRWLKESGRWDLAEGVIRGEGDGVLRYSQAVRDTYTDGYPERIRPLIERRPRPPRADLADLRLSAKVRPGENCEGVVLTIGAGGDIYEAYVPGPDSTERARIVRNRTTAWTDDSGRVRLEAGREARVSFAHVDAAAEILFDGRLAARVEWPEDPDRDFGTGNRVSLGLTGGRAAFRDLRLERDIHYTKDGQVWTEFIPEGRYFMLGDNTQNSADSRAWESITYRFKEPLEGNLELKGNWRYDPNPAEANPRNIQRPGGRTVEIFTDYLGEAYRIPPGLLESQPRVPEPYVKREYILGRALFVFWPIPPLSPVLRWKLVR